MNMFNEIYCAGTCSPYQSDFVSMNYNGNSTLGNSTVTNGNNTTGINGTVCYFIFHSNKLIKFLDGRS